MFLKNNKFSFFLLRVRHPQTIVFLAMKIVVEYEDEDLQFK